MVKATIDRIDGKLAVLIDTDDPGTVFNLPVRVIGEYQAGEIVDISITRDQLSTEAARARVSGLLEKLQHK